MIKIHVDTTALQAHRPAIVVLEDDQQRAARYGVGEATMRGAAIATRIARRVRRIA